MIASVPLGGEPSKQERRRRAFPNRLNDAARLDRKMIPGQLRGGEQDAIVAGKYQPRKSRKAASL